MTRENLDRNVRIRLSEKEDTALIKLAEVHGELNRSRMIRKMLREAIGEGPDLLKDDLNSFREAVRQVGALGRNINQIARAINSGQAAGMTVDSSLLYSVAKQVSLLQAELMAVVARTRLRWVKHE